LSAAVQASAADRGSRPDPLAGIVFAALVLACFVAFFVTQRLKHTPTNVQHFDLTPFFSPTPEGRHKLEEISFKLAHSERATVQVIDSDGNLVATLLRGYPVVRYKTLSLRWNGRRGTARGFERRQTPNGHPYVVADTTGAPAKAGEYRVRLSLSGQHNPVLSPHSFTLVRP
jgi:hypothetical protein